VFSKTKNAMEIKLTMTRSGLITGALTSIFVAGACTGRKGDINLHESLGFKPNILCIVCEDISPYLGCYGDNVAYTPNLDKLAAEGIRFSNVFSVAGVCAPSRAALITGLYSSTFGANNMRTNRKDLMELKGCPPYEAVPPDGVKCYTEFMRAAGYYCTNNEKEDYQFTAPLTAWDESSRQAHWKNRPTGKPFFAIFNLMRSHESQIWAWENEPKSVRPEDVYVPPYFPDTYSVRNDIATLYTNITIMDREAGELLKELDNAGLTDSTIVIFYSDHGGPMPRGKREILDSGLKVPFLVKFPKALYAGTLNEDLISFVDIPATILSLAGVQIPAYMHGQAFLGDQKAKPREYIFAARDRMDEQTDCRRAVRDKRFKYIKNYMPETGAYMDIAFRKSMATMKELLRMRDEGLLNEDQMYWFRKSKAPEELYDLKKDPYELHNLAGNPAYESELLRLRKVHFDWMKEFGDPGPVSEKDLVYGLWPDGIQPETENPEIRKQDGMLVISCSTPGASIALQINGKGLNERHHFLYFEPIMLNPGDRVSARAYRVGYKPSEIVEMLF